MIKSFKHSWSIKCPQLKRRKNSILFAEHLQHFISFISKSIFLYGSIFYDMYLETYGYDEATKSISFEGSSYTLRNFATSSALVLLYFILLSKKFLIFNSFYRRSSAPLHLPS
jgi:hypothetical protein